MTKKEEKIIKSALGLLLQLLAIYMMVDYLFLLAVDNFLWCKSLIVFITGTFLGAEINIIKQQNNDK
tara:strand:+ start:531 stop:731 length:201 start_codon:yes stop_codon:yes gene_type:complete